MINKLVTAWTLTAFMGVLYVIYRHKLSLENESALKKIIYWLCSGYLISLFLIYANKDGNPVNLFMLMLFCPTVWVCIEIFKKFNYRGPLNLFLLAALFSAISILVLFRLHLSLDRGILVRFTGSEKILIAISQLIFILISMLGTAFLMASGIISKIIMAIEEKTDTSFWGIASLSILGTLFIVAKISGVRSPSLIAGSLQPTELIYKFFFILFLAKYLSRKSIAIGLGSYPMRDKIKEVLILFLLTCMFFLIPMLTEMGTTLLLFLVFLVMISLLSRQWYLLPLGIISVVIAVFGAALFSSRIKERVFDAWLGWNQSLKGAGMQPFKAYSAFNGSDIVGVGIGNGYPYLPKASSDYVMVGLGEEWGVVGIVILIAGFLFLLKETYLSRDFKPDFRGILLLGLPLTIVIQAFFAINGNLGLFVMSGIPLPFISLGGTACITSFLIIGIMMALLNDLPKKDEVQKHE